MKLLFLVLICILLFLVFFKSNEGFEPVPLNQVSRFTASPDNDNNDYNFHSDSNISITDQKKIEDLSQFIDTCSDDFEQRLYENNDWHSSKGANQKRLCPPNKPRCLGQSHPGHWGKCHAKNVLRCQKDYNKDIYNDGSPGDMCPPSHSKCYNNSGIQRRLGVCIKPEKEETLKNCVGDYNSSNPLQSGTCPEYIPRCVFAPNSSNGICAHKDFHYSPNPNDPDYFLNITNDHPEKYPICGRSYITHNNNENQIYLSLQQRDYGHNSRDPENRHPFHGNSVCPITEPICVGRTTDENGRGIWGTCKSIGTPPSTVYTHPPQELIKDDGTIKTTTAQPS